MNTEKELVVTKGEGFEMEHNILWEGRERYDVFWKVVSKN